ncbi:MAG TPA: SurA N-terminal domain-containing protein [Desulfobacterales bacterium]|nr:SurA N-terminal domain-containing protein [Desulfobacterales bacterium]
MLRLMRKQAGSWLIKVLLGAIVIVFVFWGVGSFRSQRGDRIATVNGDPITLDEYRDTFDNLVDQLRRRFGNNLDEDMIEKLQIKKQALNQLINNTLLLQEAKRLKFRVSNTELTSAISEITAFQRAGTFDRQLYRNVLERMRMTPEEFEAAQRNAMMIEKLSTLVTGGIKISDQEAMEWFNWANASVNIDFVLFEPDHYKDVNPSLEETKTFFESHKENYKTEAMVNVRYVHFSPDTYRSKVTISDEELLEYYNENQETFKTPKNVEARHILLRVDENATPKAVDKTQERALGILKLAKEGKDFAELAKQYSEGPTRDSGGYLGTFTKEAMVKPFADVAFSMKAGEISEPVRTRFGWHIIKVEKVNEASVLSFDQAEAQIKKKLTEERGKTLAYDEAAAVSEVSFEQDDLLKLAKDRNLKVLTTDFFSRKGPEKGISTPSKFASIAFNLSVGEISDIQEFENGYYIIQLMDKIPPKIPEFTQVKETVRADWVEEKQGEKAKADANSFLAALKNGKSMDAESKQFNLTPASTGFFKRSDSIPNIGPEREISETAFQLTNEKKLAENAIEGAKGYYIIQFSGRKTPEAENFNKEKGDIEKRLLAQKESRTFDALLTQIRSKSDISIKEEFLK